MALKCNGGELEDEMMVLEVMEQRWKYPIERRTWKWVFFYCHVFYSLDFHRLNGNIYLYIDKIGKYF